MTKTEHNVPFFTIISFIAYKPTTSDKLVVSGTFHCILQEKPTSPQIMTAGHNDPHLLFSIGNINAYHLQDGEETSLTPSGPQTLSLLMVPSASPFADTSTTGVNDGPQEDDFYLHVHLPPELDLSLPATTQIYHQPPRSYLIPRWDLGPASGAFTRVEFPKIGSGPDRVSQEEVDTFETILAQCTAFLERAKAPIGDVKSYNPSQYKPGEGYVGSGVGEKAGPGQLVLVDEENGSVVGELSTGYAVVEGKDVRPGSKSKLSLCLMSFIKSSQNLSRLLFQQKVIKLPLMKCQKIISVWLNIQRTRILLLYRMPRQLPV